MPDGNFNPIDENSVFDAVFIGQPRSGFGIPICWLYNKSTGLPAGSLRLLSDPEFPGHTWIDPNDPEFHEVKRRIEAGTCTVHYGSNYPGVSREDVPFDVWEVHLENPFGPMHEFIEYLARDGSFTKGANGLPDTFKFPGAVESTLDPSYTRRSYYKRAATTPSVPDVTFDGDSAALDAAMAAAGWTRLVPDGFDNIYKLNVEFGQMTNGMAWWDPSIVIPETGIQVSWRNRIRMLARAFYDWQDGYTGAQDLEYALSTIWWKSWLGFAWEYEQRTTFSISVFDTAVPRASRAISGREDVMAWIVEHLETWAKRGFQVFKDTVQVDVINPILAEPSLTHVAANGFFGETLVGARQTPDWIRYQARSYRDATGVKSVVTANAGTDKAVVSGGTVTLDGSVTVEHGFGDTTYAWVRESGTGGTLSAADVAAPTLTAPTLMVGDDPAVIVWKLTTTNDGVSDSDLVAVTVTAPVETP